MAIINSNYTINQVMSKQQPKAKQFLLKIFHEDLVGERMVTESNLLQKVRNVIAPHKSFPIDMKTLLFMNINNGEIFHCGDSEEL